MTWEGLTPPYSTLVIDPPWDHSDGTGIKSHYPNGPGGKPELVPGYPVTKVPYSVMSVDEIASLDVPVLLDEGAHLYLWTTNRYLLDAHMIASRWGFSPSKVLVWCKSPKAPFMGGAFGGASVEFCLFARKGNLSTLDRAGRQWWEWPRRAHSVKPSEFMDIVERVSPGPYVELFARQPRLGWDHWGYGYEQSA